MTGIILNRLLSRNAVNVLIVGLLWLVTTSCGTGLVPNRELASENIAYKFHVIFDIDWTLVVPLSDEQADLLKGHPNLLKVHDESYILKEGAKEVLYQAFTDQKIAVSFFSGGLKRRNDELLRQLKFADGTTAYERAYKILSKGDLTVVSEDPALRFSQRYKKDIAKISPNVNKALLIEDIEHFALGPGEKQTLWLGRTYFPKIPGKSWKESNDLWRKTGVEERFLATDAEASWWNQRKLFYLEGLLGLTSNPNEIVDTAKSYQFSEDSVPDNWQTIMRDRATYKQYLSNLPCEGFIIF